MKLDIRMDSPEIILNEDINDQSSELQLTQKCFDDKACDLKREYCEKAVEKCLSCSSLCQSKDSEVYQECNRKCPVYLFYNGIAENELKYGTPYPNAISLPLKQDEPSSHWKIFGITVLSLLVILMSIFFIYKLYKKRNHINKWIKQVFNCSKKNNENTVEQNEPADVDQTPVKLAEPSTCQNSNLKTVQQSARVRHDSNISTQSTINDRPFPIEHPITTAGNHGSTLTVPNQTLSNGIAAASNVEFYQRSMQTNQRENQSCDQPSGSREDSKQPLLDKQDQPQSSPN